MRIVNFICNGLLHIRKAIISKTTDNWLLVGKKSKVIYAAMLLGVAFFIAWKKTELMLFGVAAAFCLFAIFIKYAFAYYTTAIHSFRKLLLFVFVYVSYFVLSLLVLVWPWLKTVTNFSFVPENLSSIIFFFCIYAIVFWFVCLTGDTEVVRLVIFCLNMLVGLGTAILNIWLLSITDAVVLKMAQWPDHLLSQISDFGLTLTGLLQLTINILIIPLFSIGLFADFLLNYFAYWKKCKQVKE